jgi:hypothetical protein
VPEPTSRLAPEDRRWLHDKFERLSAEEAQLASARTTYYAAIGTVLITGLVVVLADLLNEPRILIVVVTFFSGLGILISFVWAVLLHRTNDAQKLWREAAGQMERDIPPLEGEWNVPITLRSGDTLKLNMLRPYLAHKERFSAKNPISWMDGVNPEMLTEILPLTFLTIWGGVLLVSWVWYLFLR